MENINKCNYCAIMLKHIETLKNELNKMHGEYKKVTLDELKCYYWLLNEYRERILLWCEWGNKSKLEEVLDDLVDIFENNEKKLEIEKRKCDICKILPCEIFFLLDSVCTCCDEQKNIIDILLQYHVALGWIYEEFIGRCIRCDEFVDYIACLENADKYLWDGDLSKLQQFVYSWKNATNSDRIWDCVKGLKRNREIAVPEIGIEEKITVYLDFNIYGDYEKEGKVKSFLDELILQDGIKVIYSGTHLEEILRMENEEYEFLRVKSIQALTKGKIVGVGEDKRLVICTVDIEEMLNSVKQYQKLNCLAEEKECIKVEAREKLALHTHDDKRGKRIGASSLLEIVENGKEGMKRDIYLPDEEEVNKILKYVGIGNYNIQEYKSMLKNSDKVFSEVRAAIVSLAGLLNVIGLNGDKISKPNEAGARYPIYDKNNFRTIRSGFYDNDHLSYASKCKYFVTKDEHLYKKAKEIYGFLGINTIPILLKDFMNMKVEDL